MKVSFSEIFEEKDDCFICTDSFRCRIGGITSSKFPKDKTIGGIILSEHKNKYLEVELEKKGIFCTPAHLRIIVVIKGIYT